MTEAGVLEIERGALDRWGKGDPDGYLEVSSAQVTYFDPFVERRLDGRDELKSWYEPFRGKIRIESDEIIAPKVQLLKDAAVLSFQYLSRGSEGAMRWNCTEVYERHGETWKIIHTHWSFTAPDKSK